MAQTRAVAQREKGDNNNLRPDGGRGLSDPGRQVTNTQMPAEMDTGETVSVVIMALTLTIIATLYPSWAASRLDPVEALRNE